MIRVLATIGTLALAGAMLLLTGCVDEEGAQRALEDQGYTNIELGDSSDWFDGCGKGDSYSTPFTATSIAGRQVKGVVCEGGSLGKGATIRTF